jgi:hypothetical protein
MGILSGTGLSTTFTSVYTDIQSICTLAEHYCLHQIRKERNCGLYECSSIMRHLYIFMPDFDILWDNKEQQLLRNYYFKYSIYL